MKRTKKKNGYDKFIACNDDSKKKFEFKNPQESVLKSGNRREPIEIVTDKNGFDYLVWKKRKYPVEILEKSQNKYEVLINGVSYNFSVESPISYKRKKFLAKNKQNSKVEKVQAPMPGKIVEFLVEEDQTIKQGEPLLILEAMKMQNEIVSSANGVIKNINYKAEDTVMKDDILIELEKV